MAITKNIVTDYGADNTGVADVGPKFYTSLKTDMAGQDCNLTVPAGSYSFQSKPGGFFWATGMTSLNVTATGSQWLESGTSSPVLGSFHMTQIGIDAVGGKSARIQTVAAGATTVALTTTGLPSGLGSAGAGYISRAVVGNWMLVAGNDIQGLFQSAYGFPSNNHFFDYVQITAVDTVNKTITFSPALTESYRADWPEFNRGSSFEVDSGGPATVYFLDSGWGAPKTFNGGTYQNTNLIHCEGKDFTISNGNHSLGGLPVYPSINKNWSAINHDVSGAGAMELDKFVENTLFDGGASHQFHCQSSSLKNVTIRNTTMDASIIGTGRNTLIENCVIGGSLSIGCDGYGRADTFVCRNTSVAGSISNVAVRDTGPTGEGISTAWSMTNGLITIPMSYTDSLGRMFVPDPYGRNVLFWRANSGRMIGSFQVLSVTGDSWPAVDNQTATTNITSTNASKTVTVSANLFNAGDVGKVIFIPGASSGGTFLKTFVKAVGTFSGTQDITVYHPATRSQSAVSGTLQWGTCNMYVQTNQSGGLPDSSLWIGSGTGVLHCEQPAARSVSFENVTGSVTADDLSQVAARNRPPWSYTKRTYNGTEKLATSPAVNIIGNVVSIKVNVLTAYTGVRPTLTVGLTQFDNLSVVTNGALATYAPRVNLRVTGERVITAIGVTGAWAGTNPDTGLSLGGTTFLPNTYAASVSQDITGESASLYPSYTIEIITDQGFFTGPTAVVPLRLRLRA